MQINFDMDGTIVDFYSSSDWLTCLEAELTCPYDEARPLCNFSQLARLLNNLQAKGHKICIISWLSKNATEEYEEEVINSKIFWLAKHLPSVQFDKITIIPYGTPKSLYGEGILFDDEEKNRNMWNGQAYSEKEIFEILNELLPSKQYFSSNDI